MEKYDEEEVFWKQYVEIEQTNHTDYKMDIVASTCKFFYDVFEYTPTEAERALYHNFIAKTQPISIGAVFCLWIYAMLNTGILTGKAPPVPEPYTFFSYRASMLPWVACFLGCFVVTFLTCTKNGLRILKMLNYDSIDILHVFGLCIFFARALRFVQAVTYTMLDPTDMCIETMYSHPDDDSYRLIIARIVTDVIVVVCGVALLPFRRVHILCFFFVEGAYQTLRFQSCRSRLNLPKKFDLFCWSISCAIVGLYLVVMVYPAFTLERSINATQRNKDKLKDAAAEKTYLINTLCADLKIPVQRTSTLLAMLLPYASKGLEADLYAQMISKDALSQNLNSYLDKNMSAISGVVDRILFLMRIREGRFTFACSENVGLAEVSALAVRDFLACYGLINLSSSSTDNEASAALERLFCVDIAVPSADGGESLSASQMQIKSNKSCLSVLLFYSISVVLIDVTLRNFVGKKGRSSKLSSALQGVLRSLPNPLIRAAPIYPADRRDNKQAESAIDFSSMLAAILRDLKVRIDMRVHHWSSLPVLQARRVGASNSEYVLICRVSFDDQALLHRRKAHAEDKPGMSTQRHENHDTIDDFMYHYQSCMMLCQEVSRCCGGEFSVLPNGAVEFSLPCHFESAPTNGGKNCAAGSKHGENGRNTTHSHNQLQTSTSSASAPTIASAEEESSIQESTINPDVLSRICIYCPSPSILSLITENLKRAVSLYSPVDSRPNTDGAILLSSGRAQFPIPSFSVLNMADMHVRSVVIVSSIEDCHELRTRGYMNKVILMSERLAYYGQLGGKYDFAVSLPLSSAQESQKLVKWINVNAIPSKTELIPSYEQSVVQEFNNNYLLYIREVQNFLSSAGNYVWQCIVWTSQRRLVPHIDSRHMLNYARWKYLNPTQYWLHHTCIIELYLIFIAVVVSVNIISETASFSNLFYGTMSLYAFLFARRIHHSVFVSWNQWLLRLVHIGFTLWTVAFFLQVLRMAYYARKFQREYSGDSDQDISTVLDSSYTSVAGKGLINFPMVAPSLAKILSEMVMWPYSIMLSTLAFFIAFIMTMGYWPLLFNSEGARFATVIQLTVAAAVSVVIVFTERLRRKEYLELREVVMSRDFVERCVSACWRDTRNPLASITSLQSNLYSVISMRCLRKEILITPLLQNRLRDLCGNVSLSKELLQAMQMSLMSMQKQRSGDTSSLIQSMDTHFLNPVVQSVCAMFLSTATSTEVANDAGDIDHLSLRYFDVTKNPCSCIKRDKARNNVNAINSAGRCDLEHCGVELEEDLHYTLRAAERYKGEELISFHVKIHPSVFLIRFDLKLLQAMLHAACRSAVDRIKASQLHSRRKHHTAKASEVLILVAPAIGQESLKFTDVHMLQIKIFDTASTVSSDSNLLSEEGADKGVEMEQLFIAAIYERYIRHHYSPENYADLVKRVSLDWKFTEGIGGEEFSSRTTRLYSLQRIKGDPAYRFVQSILIPYKLLPLTPKVSNFFLPAADDLVDPSNSSNVHSERQRRTKKANAHSRLALHKLSLSYTESYAFYCAKFTSYGKATPSATKHHFTVNMHPFRVLFLLSSKREPDFSYFNQLPAEFNCAAADFERSHTFLSARDYEYPSIHRIAATHCVILDDDLQSSGSSKYVQDLILYLRTSGYEGLVVKVLPRMTSSTSDSTMPCSDQTSTTQDRLSEKAATEEDLLALLMGAPIKPADAYVDLMSADEEVSWPITLEALFSLKRKAEDQLIRHSIPSLL